MTKEIDETDVSVVTPTVNNTAEQAVAVIVPEGAADDGGARSTPPASNATATVFAWVAFILINSAFVALILWGSFRSSWWIGLVVDVVYTIGLLGAGIWLRRQPGWKTSVLSSLVFLVAILSMAVAGLYLPIFVFPCGENVNYWNDDDYYHSSKKGVVTDKEQLPTKVASWWKAIENNRNNYTYRSMIHLESTGVTLFEGTQEGRRWDYELFRVQGNGTAPELVTGFEEVAYFVQAEPSLGCFRASRDYKIVCTTDGIDFAETEEQTQTIEDMIYSNQRLWFESRVVGGYGPFLYSVDPLDLPSGLTPHSVIPEQNNNNDKIPDVITTDDDDECSFERTLRIRFLSWLFLSALPATLTAIIVDWVHKFAIPTMPIGTYVTLTWGVVCLAFAIDPNFDEYLYNFFRWWLVFTTGPWLIVLVLQHLTKRSLPSRRMWSINFASLVYAPAMFFLVGFFNYWGDGESWWMWLVVNLAVIPPLIMVSVVTGNIFVLVVMSAVILIDVWRLVDYISCGLMDCRNYLPTQCVVLGLSGLLLGFLGYLLSRKQSRIAAAVSNWANNKLGRWVVPEESPPEVVPAAAVAEGTVDTDEAQEGAPAGENGEEQKV